MAVVLGGAGVALLAAQGRWVRRRVPRLPPAEGPRSGVVGGASGRPWSVLLLGDSTAVGVGAASQQDALGAQIGVALARISERPVHWRAVGRSGARARTVRCDILHQLDSTRFDVAVITVGVNDATAFTRVAAYRREMAALVEELRRHADIVVVSGLPPLSVFPALPQPLRAVLGWRARKLDAVLRTLAAGADDVEYVGIAGEEGGFADDGFHPGPAGYRAWGEAVALRIDRLGRRGPVRAASPRSPAST